MLNSFWKSFRSALVPQPRKNKLIRGKSRLRGTAFHTELLERRVMLSANQIYYAPTLSAVVIEGTASSDSVSVSTDAANIVHVSMSNATGTQTATFSAAGITQIRFTGGDGNDYFENFTSIASLALGENGDDILITQNGNGYLDGGAGNDMLIARYGDNQLYGRDGNDTIYGGAGNDIIYGGTGNDTIVGGSGNNDIYGEDGDDVLYGGSGDDVLSGGAGNDVIHGDTGNDTIYGDDGNDKLYGDDGADSIYAGTGNDLLQGGAANDILYGGDGVDTLTGDDGNDSLYGEGDGDSLTGGAGNDYLNGGAGSNELHGGAGDDILTAGDGFNRLYGEDGNDSLTGGASPDLLDGGAGNDNLYGGGGNDTLLGGDDSDNLYGGDAGDYLDGGAGNDYLNGGAGDNNVHGGAGDDTLVVGDGNNRLYGEDGNDSLTGGAGGDLLDGGAGDDTLFGGPSNFVGSDGNDTLLGGDGSDDLYGGGGDDYLDGGAGNDYLNGGTGNNQLHGGAGDDTLVVGDGNNRMYGEDGNDYLAGGAGKDQLDGGAGDDSVLGGQGDDNLLGGDGNDILYGNDGNDTLFGGAGNDQVDGGTGNDLVVGGLGKDQLTGNDGDDILIGGSTAYDQNAAAITQLMAAWTTTDSYAARVQAISAQLFTARAASGDDPSIYSSVVGGQVIDDQVSDSLIGGNGQDWFFKTGSMPMYLPSDVDSPLQATLSNGDTLLQCGDQIMKLTNQMPTVEGFSLFDSLDTLSDLQSTETQTSLVPKAGSQSLEQEHLALMQLVRYDQVTNYAVRSGAWSDPTTWHGGVVPASGANVLIPVGVEVQVDGMIPARLKTVRVDGTLSFNATRNTQLQVDTIVVSDCGELHMGTSDNPVVKGVTAKLLIIDNGAINRTWDPFGISRGLISQGAVTIYGSQVDSYSAMLVPATAGMQLLTLKKSPVGWKAGDEVIIASTVEGVTQNEVRHIVNVVGNSVMLDQPLTYNHLAPQADLDVNIADVTRNAVIQSESTLIDHRGHVMFMHSDNVHIAYGGFYDLGRTDKSQPINDPVVLADWTLKPGTGTNPRARYALHFHRTGTVNDGDPATVVGSAVVGSPGWGFVNHSSYVDFTEDVAYGVNGAAFTTEVGDEIGGFYNNLAIGTTGTGEAEVMNARENVQDFGFQGDGFWLQGGGVSVVGNISAGNLDNAFVLYTKGFGFNGVRAQFSTANLVDPSIAQGASSIPVGWVPIREFSDNVGYSSTIGLTLRYHLQNTVVDEQSFVENSTFWGDGTGVYLPYTEHTTLKNVRVINGQTTGTWSGITGNIATQNDNYIDLTVTGYTMGIELPRHGTSVISGGTYHNTYDFLIYTAALSERHLTFTNLPANAIFTTVVNTATWDDKTVDVFFVKDTIILNYAGFVNQQLFFVSQAASYVPVPLPESGSPAKYVGLTNQQLWDLYGLALGGKVAPNSTTTSPSIIGLLAPFDGV